MDRFSKAIDNLYEKTGVPRVFPVPVFDLAKALGYELYNFEIDEENSYISGAVLYAEKKILLNPLETHQRRNFTLAHEIAHIVLNHSKGKDEIIDTRINIQKPTCGTIEWDANQFAGELLMPEEEFRKCWTQYKSLAKLASFFNVSISAMSVRMKVLEIEI